MFELFWPHQLNSSRIKDPNSSRIKENIEKESEWLEIWQEYLKKDKRTWKSFTMIGPNI